MSDAVTRKPNRMFPGWSEVVETHSISGVTTKKQAEAIARRMENPMGDDHEDDDDGMDAVMKDLATIGDKKKSDLPEPEQKPLTADQLKILDELPDEAGHYWVENVMTGERNVAYIDKSRTENTVEHWGTKMSATYGGIGAIDRWFMAWTVLTRIEPYKDTDTYENNASYGMF